MEVADIQTLDDLDAAIRGLTSGDQGTSAIATAMITQLWSQEGLSSEISTDDIRVAGILRIVAADSYYLYDHPDRRQVIRFLRERLAETNSKLPKRYKIGRPHQADEISQSLARIATDAEAGIAAALESYDGIASLEKFRNSLLKALNDDRSRAAFRPFLALPSDPSDSFQKCLTSAIEYSQSTAESAPAHLDNAVGLIERLEHQLSQVPTSVARPITLVLQRLRRDLADHFEISPFSKPASVTLATDLRLHPLHVEGLELSVPIELRNDGLGVALDLELEMSEAIGIKLPIGLFWLSDLAPGSMLVEFNVRTDPESMKGLECAACIFRLTWRNSDGTTESSEIEAELRPQDPDVDWNDLAYTNPYSLEAVETEDELAGRSEMLKSITRVLSAQRVESVYIHGQKRVGKTSLAHVALKVVGERRGAETIYIETGEIISPTPSTAIDGLARALIEQLDDRYRLPSELRDASYDGSLTPLVRALKSVVTTERPVLIAIDEFDRLPTPLYRRGAEGDAFFTALRSIATIEGVGLLLIGGERMKIIINGPGVELNRFNAFSVDYLDRATQWSDFEELVRNPAGDYIRFTNEACERIYDYTAGNPYYTKQLCGKILELAIHRRDAYVDVREVESGAKALLKAMDAVSFAHYWEDHVLESDSKRDEVTLKRRRCLLALGSAWAVSDIVATEDVAREAGQLGLSYAETDSELRQFKERGFLLEEGGNWTPRVNLFRRWICDYGQTQLVVSAAELESVEALVRKRASLRISTEEADDVADSLGSYRGRSISGDKVLEYLRQFGEASRQRLILKLLQHITPISNVDENHLFRQAFEAVTQRLKERDGDWNQRQIALSYFGPSGKSSAAAARMFNTANGRRFQPRGVIEPIGLASLVDSDVTDVIVVDDFVGSGDTLVDGLADLRDLIPASTQLHVFVLAAHPVGLERVVEFAQEQFADRCIVDGMQEVLGDPALFSVSGGIFESEQDCIDAKALVNEFGSRLSPQAPLGYRGCCSLVKFASTIPNDAPPILWRSSSGTFEFKALFERNSPR